MWPLHPLTDSFTAFVLRNTALICAGIIKGTAHNNLCITQSLPIFEYYQGIVYNPTKIQVCLRTFLQQHYLQDARIGIALDVPDTVHLTKAHIAQYQFLAVRIQLNCIVLTTTAHAHKYSANNTLAQPKPPMLHERDWRVIQGLYAIGVST